MTYDLWVHLAWYGEKKKIIPLLLCFPLSPKWSWTIGVSTRATKIKVAAIIYDIIALGVRHECRSAPGSPATLWTINDIEIFEETSLAGPFICEMATAHLCRGVLPKCISILHVSSPCNSWSTISQDREYGRWPISKVSVVNFQPPVSPCIKVLPHCTWHANQNDK